MSDKGFEQKKIPSPISFVSEPPKHSDQPPITSFASYSGPIPPPNFLVQYEEMVPGIAKKFLEEPHIEAEHRRSIEKMMAQEQIGLAKKGQIMAFSLASFCVTAAFVAIYLGYSLEGLGALIASIGTFACIFIYAKKRQ